MKTAVRLLLTLVITGTHAFKFIEDPKCPPVTPRTPAQCQGQRSNCWSPGVRDLDCPGSGLCCYDGCANTCVSSSPPPRAPPPSTTRRPQPPPTTRRPRPPPTTRKPKPPPQSYIPLPPAEEVYQPPPALYQPPPDTTPAPPPPPPAYHPPVVAEPSNTIEIRKLSVSVIDCMSLLAPSLILSLILMSADRSVCYNQIRPIHWFSLPLGLTWKPNNIFIVLSIVTNR